MTHFNYFLVVFAAIIVYNEVKSDADKKVATNRKQYSPHIFLPRSQISRDTGFSNTFGEPAQQNYGQRRPSGQTKRPTTQAPTTSATSTTSAEDRIVQCVRDCRGRFVNFADYVCASDGVTYMNEPHFNCAVRCGRSEYILYNQLIYLFC